MQAFRVDHLQNIDYLVYTDGSFDPVLQRGNWGFVVYHSGVEIAEECCSVDGGDNSAAELAAVLAALEWIRENAKHLATTLLSDSVYVVRGCNEWRFAWRSSAWRRRTAGGRGRNRSIPNASHWEKIDAHLQELPLVRIEWCKGHAASIGNLRADALAAIGRLSKFDDDHRWR